MDKINAFMDKLLKIAPGGYYGLLSMTIGILFISLSYLLVPGYSMFESFISILGISPGLAAPLFNMGIILTGILVIPFLVYLGRSLTQERINKKIEKIAFKISIIGAISISLVGCFPHYTLLLGIIHIFFATIFFLSELIFCIMFSLLIWFDSRFSKMQSIIGFVVSGVFIFFIFTGWTISEWLVFFAIIFWVIENSIYTLHKKI